MPGLIDAHWHSFMAATAMPMLTTANPSYLHILATRQAEATLMRGFTTVRDMGGPVFGLKRAIDDGTIKGPRIYPSGAIITVTSGHGDFRQLTELPRTIGGMLSQWSVIAPFWFAAVLSILNAVLMWIVLPEPDRHAARQRGPVNLKQTFEQAGSWRLGIVTITYFIAIAGFAIVTVIYPQVSHRRFELNQSQISFIFVMFGLIGYGIDQWRGGSSHVFLIVGLLLGIVVGFVELARFVWKR